MRKKNTVQDIEFRNSQNQRHQQIDFDSVYQSQFCYQKMQQSMHPLGYPFINSSNADHLIDHPLLQDDIKHTYEQILSSSKLKLHHQISYRNIRIYEEQFIHQIHTVHPPQSQIPHLVFLHGFGGTSMTGIRLFQYLYKKFQVHALDCFGMGYSSRGNFRNSFDESQTLSYYIDAIEQWRKKLNIQKMVLVGHSFGGYLATCYCQKYKERIQRLILLSPAGYSKQFRSQQNINCSQKMFYCLAEKIYNINIRPSAAFNNYFLGDRLLNSIISNRLKLREQQKQTWKKYFKDFSSQKHSSQEGFYRLFSWPLSPVKSIEEIIIQSKFEFKIDFYYGDMDWMSRNGIQKLLKTHKNISLTIVPNAGHQMVFDNPETICQSIIHKCF